MQNLSSVPLARNSDVSFNEGTRYVAIAVIVIAIFNPILRPAPDVSATPYYFIFSLIFAWMIIVFPDYRKSTAISFIVLGYGVFVGYLNATPWLSMLFQSLKYWQLWTFLGFLTFVKLRVKNGVQLLSNIAFFSLYVSLSIALFQQLFGYEIPTVVNEESYLWINTYFYTPNDLALFLGGMFCIILISDRSLFEKIALITLIFALNLRNDAKAIMIASVVVFVLFYMLSFARAFKIKLIYLVPLVIFSLYPAIYFGINSNVDLYETNFDFYRLFIDPVDRIINFDPYNLGGSIYDRTDALIYNVEALFENYFLGLGPGGSVYLLSLSNYELLTAKSLHNAVAEFIVEFGIVGAIICFAVLVRPAFRALQENTPSRHDAMKVAFFVATPMFSVSQSSGFISNYAFWLTAFLVWSVKDGDHSASGFKPEPVRQVRLR